jgi:hypothetical protein
VGEGGSAMLSELWVADVAELADAPDSKFHFRRFRAHSCDCLNSDKTLVNIGKNSLFVGFAC